MFDMEYEAEERGCGFREDGGIYSMCLLSTRGTPIEEYLVDPPLVIDINEIGLSSIGVKLIQNEEGYWDVWDVVGSNNYPNACDMIEEIKRLGMSRRLPSTLEFDKLTLISKHILIHARGYTEQFNEFDRYESCPKSIFNHDRIWPTEMCIGRYYDALIEAEKEGDHVVRTIPCKSYIGYSLPENLEIEWKHAVFMSLPITCLHVVGDSEKSDNSYEKATEAGTFVFRVEN